jgi:hypothetical protein
VPPGRGRLEAARLEQLLSTEERERADRLLVHQHRHVSS